MGQGHGDWVTRQWLGQGVEVSLDVERMVLVEVGSVLSG